jgi:hypothetical protein
VNTGKGKVILTFLLLECIKEINQLFTYEEAIVLGTVVQLFYKIPETLLNVDINTYVSERDRVIRDRASAFDGKPCGTVPVKPFSVANT